MELEKIDFEPDYKIGEVIATKKLAAIKQGLEDNYQPEITNLLRSELDINLEYSKGSILGHALNEGARRSLLGYCKASIALGVIGYSTCLLIGWKPLESLAVLPASSLLAVASQVKLYE